MARLHLIPSILNQPFFWKDLDSRQSMQNDDEYYGDDGADVALEVVSSDALDHVLDKAQQKVS